ncbi:uncharacterized protein LOC124494923 [Dermatophagoides farinae]|uniref:uncharacterized protein LOC124494923 n=1 Tax=Dermatophagoides farinae TaxID=6954 RepID=UPI003F6140DA
MVIGVCIILMMMTNETQTDDDDNKMTTTAQPKDETCETLHNHNGTKLNILAVGRTPTRLILITNDFYVYDVSIDSIDSAINKLYLRTKPIPLSEKYPVLYNNDRFYFMKLMNQIYGAFIATDVDNSEWICMMTWAYQTAEYGINFNIEENKVYKGWLYFREPQIVMISTTVTCAYYVLHKNNYGNVQIGMFKCMGTNRIRDKAPMYQMIEYRNFCYDYSGQKITVESDGCRSANPVQWPVLKGFTDSGKFYLFGQYYIYIFDENVVHEQGSSYPVTKRSYDSFFNCGGYIPSGQVSRSFFLWIIATIIVLLMILMIILWCILTTKRKRTYRSLIHAKTTRSDYEGVGPRNRSMMLTQKASMRSCNSIKPKKLSSNSKSIIKPPIVGGGRSTTISCGSTPATVRTGFNCRNASSSSNNNLNNNRFKCLTPKIQSSRNR